MIRWRLRKWWNHGGPEFQDYLRAGWRRLNKPGVPGNLGQLLYYYDSAHFFDYLRRFQSADYAANVEIFRAGAAGPDGDPALKKKQWERAAARA